MSARRIIDANANRAREALRVMEDCARFSLDDTHLCAQLKSLRHGLQLALESMPGGEGARLAHRDTPNDVGTQARTITEYKRTGQREVVLAGAKRLTEALRSIEEHCKTLSSLEGGGTPVAQRIEQLRYGAYDLEQRLVLALGTGRARQWRLCVLLSEHLCTHHDWLTVACEATKGGADCLQLREDKLDDRELLDRARELVEVAHPTGVSVIINNRPDIALLAKADGVHVGQSDLSVRDIRRLAGFDLLAGVSTSSIEQAQGALRDGTDYCGLGPMYPSTTKPKDVIAGSEYVRAYVAHEPALPPHLAIGGLTPGNAHEVVEAGARGLAVSSCVCASETPGRVCEQLREIVESRVAPLGATGRSGLPGRPV